MDPLKPVKDQDIPQATAGSAPLYQHDSLEETPPRQGPVAVSPTRNILRALGFILLHQVVMALAFLLLTVALFMPRFSANTPGDLPDLQPGSPFWEQIQVEMLSADHTALTSLLAACLLIPLTSFYLRKRRKSNPYAIMTEKPQSPAWAWSLWALLAAQGLAMAWLHFLDWASQYSAFIASRVKVYEEVMNMIADDQVNVGLALLATCIFVPIMEELIYRGVVMGELRQICSDRTAILIQAAIFGLIHANFIQSVYAFVLGLVIGYIYYKSQSILLSIASHVLFNFLGGGLPILVGEDSIMIQTVFILEILALVSFLIYLGLRLVRRPRLS